mmetsp:Transcript_7430/g.11175  ORF Transcript_7430/g.11175 Transcript_7430/m.11175 type:complete len:238 (-) Transcript_7430:516-1229(-)
MRGKVHGSLLLGLDLSNDYTSNDLRCCCIINSRTNGLRTCFAGSDHWRGLYFRCNCSWSAVKLRIISNLRIIFHTVAIYSRSNGSLHARDIISIQKSSFRSAHNQEANNTSTNILHVNSYPPWNEIANVSSSLDAATVSFFHWRFFSNFLPIRVEYWYSRILHLCCNWRHAWYHWKYFKWCNHSNNWYQTLYFHRSTLGNMSTNRCFFLLIPGCFGWHDNWFSCYSTVHRGLGGNCN